MELIKFVWRIFSISERQTPKSIPAMNVILLLLINENLPS